MRRLFTLFLLCTGFTPGATVIDRVAVIAGRHVIKLSDVQRGLRVTEFMNRQPINLNTSEMHNEAERLVEQTLIRDEIAGGGYPAPAETAADSLVHKLVTDRFGGSDLQLRAALSRYGLTEDELRGELSWQLTVLRFIDQRFRPGVQLSDDEVQAYYKEHLPELQREYPGDHAFDTLQPKIRASLEGERVNQAFEEWLTDQRKQVHIEYREGAFQ